MTLLRIARLGLCLSNLQGLHLKLTLRIGASGLGMLCKRSGDREGDVHCSASLFLLEHHNEQLSSGLNQLAEFVLLFLSVGHGTQLACWQ